MKKILFISSLIMGFYGFDIAHSAETDVSKSSDKPVMVSKYEVSCSGAKDNKYSVDLTVLFKVEPNQGICEIIDESIFVAINEKGDKIPLELQKNRISSFPKKWHGQLIYECELSFDLPKGYWSIEGDAQIRYGKSLKSISVDVTKQTQKVIQGPYLMEIIGESYVASSPKMSKITLNWSDFIPLSHVRYLNDSGKWETSDPSSLYREKKGVYINFGAYSAPEGEKLPMQIFLWTEVETKKVPIKFDMAIGVSKEPCKN